MVCPRDYPYSVKKGYAGFSNYTFISNFLFSAMNFVTTQVLINALNLNISKTTGLVFSAGMNWAIKEGLGQMGNNLAVIYFLYRFDPVYHSIQQYNREECKKLESNKCLP